MNRIVAVVAAAVLSVGLTVPPALADAVYHSSHIALLPTGDTPLRSGFVENIHVNARVPQLIRVLGYGWG
jgi:hypothetical protein